MLTACYLLNRVPNKRNKTTPYELWFYVIEPNDSVSINSIIESRDAIFNENRFSSIPRPKDVIPNSVESQWDDHSDDAPSEIPKPRKGKRVRKAKSYGYDFQLYLVEGSRDQVGSQYSYWYSIKEDPMTYNEAMQSRDAAFWKEAIDDEIGSIMENNTWVLSDLPLSCKSLGCKWIFKRKMKVDGTIDKLLLALAAIHNLVIHQMDVKTRFLNGDLDEEVYMKQPEGFVMPCNEHKVCKLVKSFTPMDPVEKLKPNTGKPVDQLEYSRAIGCLMYAMTSTRPDIAYAVGRLSRFTSNPSRQHWQAIIRVFKYLKGTMNYGLSYVGYPSVLKGYSNVSWINHVEDSSSTSGWVFLLGGGAISWASKKQTCITGSTMES
ncbi:zinc finger, CCHC-type containing protein [Tanacetum coccineum]|uniref:Zinc finger, CCHC-type containing protein n=1 Tax=Tanacetum coccineum TaxID=301880 RepID=A0ABQ4ZB47_9ASTR